ncbi:MAG: SCO family protein [Rhodospirillales bacterium]|nr:SCO family protein [Rhodospirillales bacterium]
MSRSSAPFAPSRRAVLLAGVPALFGLAQAAPAAVAPGVTVAGAFPNLAFTMRRSSDGKTVTAADYRGKVVVLYFGFTRCPDVCPLTMQNAAVVLKRMGPLAKRVRVLFVTIDLAYDTLPRLKAYLAHFAPPPEMDGLRGTPAELAALAKRYAVQYHAPPNLDAPDPVSKVTHSAAVYLFDAEGRVQQILDTMGLASADIAAIAADIEPFARRA